MGVCLYMTIHNRDHQALFASLFQIFLKRYLVAGYALVGGVVHAKPSHAPLLMPFALRRDEGIRAERRLPADEGLLVACLLYTSRCV